MANDTSLFQDISDYVRVCKDVVSLISSSVALIPKGSRREEAERKLAAAQDALKRADVALAKQLGMKLCDCTFPPQIMLWRQEERAHVCPNGDCGRVVKPPTRRALNRARYLSS